MFDLTIYIDFFVISQTWRVNINHSSTRILIHICYFENLYNNKNWIQRRATIECHKDRNQLKWSHDKHLHTKILSNKYSLWLFPNQSVIFRQPQKDSQFQTAYVHNKKNFKSILYFWKSLITNEGQKKNINNIFLMTFFLPNIFCSNNFSKS